MESIQRVRKPTFINSYFIEISRFDVYLDFEFPDWLTLLLYNCFSLGDRTDISEALRDPRRDPLWVVIPITVLYVVIFVSGVVGNVSTCIVIARNKHMHTATNYYLFSLAVSDLLQLLSGLPPECVHIWSK